MSFKVANLEANPSSEELTVEPKILEGLFTLGGDVSPKLPELGEIGGVPFRAGCEVF